MIKTDAVYQKNKKLPWRVIEDCLVIVHLQDETVISLNETGAELWNLIDGKHSVEELINYLTDNFEVDSQMALDDVHFFISYLLEKEVIHEQNTESIRS
jgi:hypothetical protein